jgi:hypothetical protein
MNSADVTGSAAKLELARKTFRTTFDAVDQQWSDAASRDFHETHLKPMEPNIKTMLTAVARLAEVLAAAERECGDDH